MKVIVIRQPWAWLIVNGIKDIENRSWRTRYRGPLLSVLSAKVRDPVSPALLTAACRLL
jgi:ASCH domain